MLIAFAVAALSTPLETRAKEATVAWVNCLRGGADALSQSAETADVVATAVMARCSTEEDAASSAWFPLSAPIYGPDYDPIGSMRKALRDKVTGQIVERRLTIAKP